LWLFYDVERNKQEDCKSNGLPQHAEAVVDLLRCVLVVGFSSRLCSVSKMLFEVVTPLGAVVGDARCAFG
jgi:hypothetical protein